MTRPVNVPGYGKLSVREILKEELIGLRGEIAFATHLDVNTGGRIQNGETLAPHHFRVITDRGSYETNRVVLAIGRRGVPRKLGVPGEVEASHVAYALREPEAFGGDRVLVVGGGDSAVEAALALSEQPGTEVRLSYRGEAFSRIKPGNHERIQASMAQGKVEVLWSSSPEAIHPTRVTLSTNGGSVDVPATQILVFIGGELPTHFLRECGVEIETHFGAP